MNTCPASGTPGTTRRASNEHTRPRTFKAFFDRCKRGDTPGFPRFKSWRRFDTADHTAGDGSKWFPTEEDEARFWMLAGEVCILEWA